MARQGFLQRHGDLLLALILAAGLTVEVFRWAPANLGFMVAVGLLATLPLALRRTAPLVSFLLVAAGTSAVLTFAADFDNQSAALIAVFLVALYSLGHHSMGHEVWLGGLAVLVCVILFDVYDNGRLDLTGVAFSLAFIAGPWTAGLAIRLRRDREVTLTERTRELERDQAEQARHAVEAERARIARELHDVVSHAITVTVLQSRGCRRMLGVDEHAVRRSLDAIEQTNTQALGDMRRLLLLLRETGEPADSTPVPSLARLESLLSELRHSGLPIELSVTGTGHDVPPGVDASAYRIIQEALTNVVRHAGQATATVSIAYGDDDLDIVVEDTGASGLTETGRGLGLVGIRERVAVVGGHVEAGPGTQGGFVVNVHLPYALQMP